MMNGQRLRKLRSFESLLGADETFGKKWRLQRYQVRLICQSVVMVGLTFLTVSQLRLSAQYPALAGRSVFWICASLLAATLLCTAGEIAFRLYISSSLTSEQYNRYLKWLMVESFALAMLFYERSLPFKMDSFERHVFYAALHRLRRALSPEARYIRWW
jgi:hypothetical protein